MHYALICTDKKPEGLEIRLENRPKHLEYLAGLGDTVVLAGPLLGDDEKTPSGSLIVVDTSSIDEAKSIADGDPYAKAGVFESVTIVAWKWLIGRPEAG